MVDEKSINILSLFEYMMYFMLLILPALIGENKTKTKKVKFLLLPAASTDVIQSSQLNNQCPACNFSIFIESFYCFSSYVLLFFILFYSQWNNLSCLQKSYLLLGFFQFFSVSLILDNLLCLKM